METFRRVWLSMCGKQIDAHVGSRQPIDERILGKQIETLYGPVRSLVIGAFCCTLVGIVVTVHTGSAILAGFVVLMSVVAAGRLLLIQAYRKEKSRDRVRDAALIWERRYRISAWIHAATVGGFVLATFTISDNVVDQLVVVAQMCGYTSGVASRNAGSLRIATGQLGLILTPAIIGSAMIAEPMHMTLAVVMFLYLAAAIEIVHYHHANTLHLLILNDEKSALAGELALQNERFDAALSNMSHGLCMVDAEQRFVVANQRFCEMFGLSVQAVHGLKVRDIVDRASSLLTGTTLEAAAISAHFEERLNSRQASSSTLNLADGRILALSQQPISGGGNVVIMEDVTERQRAETRITHMATHDALTDLPNRTLFRQRLNDRLAAFGAASHPFAVLMLDLDRFKVVNDSFGHPTGDALLRQVGERISSTLCGEDTVARLGGDEFAVLTADGSKSGVDGLSARLIARLSEPYDLDGRAVEIGVSIGAAFAPLDGSSPEELLKMSDMALYQAKAEGRGVLRYFSATMDAELKVRNDLEHDLRHALERGEFVLHYQPQVDLASGRIVGVEALVRWEHPVRGLVGPNDFIPFAEDTGLIVQIGAWVVRQACFDAVSWPGDIRVAVNLSPVQFDGGDLWETILEALAASGLDPRRLELEITESTLLANTEATVAMLHRLRDRGIRVAMDDFGIGYSSLAYLRSFPFDKIKIDRTFVSEIMTSDDCAAIVRAVAGLGQSLGVATTAEGVETSAQEEMVRRQGCTEMQGYYFSPPRPASDIVAMLKAQADAAQIAA